MGFFSNKKKKQSKVYNMAEALKILSNPRYKEYTSLEVEPGKYRIVTIEESRNLEEQIRARSAVNNEFAERISGGGVYRKMNYTPQTTPNYNNYQNAKRYKENAYR